MSRRLFGSGLRFNAYYTDLYTLFRERHDTGLMTVFGLMF